MALAGEHAHHSTGSTYSVCEFDAESAAECGRDDGSVEWAAYSVAGIAIDARPTGAMESVRAQMEFAKRWYRHDVRSLTLYRLSLAAWTWCVSIPLDFAAVCSRHGRSV